MAIFKCKMCGGSLDVAEGTTVCECEYCGTQQTIPKLHDDIMTNLFNRANHLRSKCEFDKAQEIYEKIISQNPTEAEAYWGIILCKYGIEYVEDPATFRKIPTCHRTQLESVQADADYLSALQNADTLQKEVYEREAAEIDCLQRDILSIVRNEKPFDVFICYKETDESGKRTQDSVIANDIYHQLTQEGFKVFYAAITLEDKLGEAYEPYIFAALNSAKVMLVLGTKPEYFTAVWVRNEWSRYLQLAKKDHSRLLIPCYRDMDAYDLPDEFSHLQAQDMGKIGFINDVIRGIRKVLEKPDEQKTVRETIVQTGNANTAPLLKRIKLFLEDGDWKSADEYCNKVLDIDPECSQAYYYQLMAELNIHTDAEFEQAEYTHGIADSECFKKAVRFADEQEKTRLNTLNQQIIYNVAERRFKDASTYDDLHDVREIYLSVETFKDAAEKAEQCKQKALQYLYDRASEAMQKAATEQECLDAVKLFEEIAGYQDAAERAEQCKQKAQQALYDRASEAMQKAVNEQDCLDAAKLFETILDYLDAAEKAEQCKKNVEKVRIYNRADSILRNGIAIEELENAKKTFESIQEWSDAKEKADECEKRIEELNAREQARQEDLRQRDLKFQKKENHKKIVIRIAIIVGIIIVVSGIVVGAKILQTRIAEEHQLAEIFPSYPEEDRVWLLANGDRSFGLKADGTVVTAGENSHGEGNISHWSYIVAVSSAYDHTVGLKANGKVVATGDNYWGQCDVSDWKDIVAVAAGSSYTIGLKADGTVVATGRNEDGQCDVSDWHDIVAVAAGNTHTVGLKSDGTVVATGEYTYGKCDVSDWRDIVTVIVENDCTVGLKSDGTVVATGEYTYGKCDVSDWRDIVAVTAEGDHTVGLKADGTVVATGNNEYGKCNVSDWSDIVAVAAGWKHTVGLKADGTVVATGNNEYGQCNVSDWSDIVAVAAGNWHTVGLKADGTVEVVGDNRSRQCNASEWTDIGPKQN